MKKIILTLSIMALTGGFYTLAVANDDDARVMHYEGDTVETAAAALQSLKDHDAKIADILKAETLEDSALESIHEISYSLETAIDKLIADKAGETAKLEAVDEAVQAVHYASENHEDAKVREWFAKLEAAVAAVDVEKTDSADAAEDGVYEIIIKDHKFTPDEIHAPAGQKLKLIVHNQDTTPEEFESDDFRREKIIPGNSTATIFVGPLKAGKYHFFGEFNMSTANGYLIAE